MTRCITKLDEGHVRNRGWSRALPKKDMLRTGEVSTTCVQRIVCKTVVRCVNATSHSDRTRPKCDQTLLETEYA